MTWLIEFLMQMRGGLIWLASTWMILVGLERLWPRGHRTPLRAQVRPALYWIVLMAAGTIIAMLFTQTLVALNLTKPVFYVPLRKWLDASPAPWIAYVVGPLIAMTVHDFFQYWMHRAQHRFFWRQHVIHHSIKDLSTVNSYFHPSEDLFRTLFIAVPTTVVLGIQSAGTTMAVTILLGLWGHYVHTATRVNLGPLRVLIADNQWHRIHHSIEDHHFDKNFGISVTLWDRLFGTAYFPAKDEWPATGVRDCPEIRTTRHFLLGPFMSRPAASLPSRPQSAASTSSG